MTTGAEFEKLNIFTVSSKLNISVDDQLLFLKFEYDAKSNQNNFD